jgi:hypothetical protein
MKKIFSKLIKISLFTSLILSGIPIASAQDAAAICNYASYQNATFQPEDMSGLPEDDPNTQENERTKEINKRQEAYQKRLDEKRAEFNSEAFKNYTVVIAEEPLGPGDGTFSANCARKTECALGVYDADQPKIQSCWSQYTTVSECSPSNTVTCEIVQVYVSPVGKSLLYGYVGQIYRYVAFIGGLIAVFIIIVAGIMWTSAGGNSEAISNAKAMITRSLVGLVVLFLSALILYTINPTFFTLG